MKDVIEHLHELPLAPDSYIVGSAPCVTDYVDQVPDDAFAIALNGAYVLRAHWPAWAIWRADSMEYPWWPKQRPNVDAVICGDELAEQVPWTDYTFKYRPVTTELPQAGICHGGATIAGSMFLMLCASPKVHRIHLCGIMMHGPIDFDGCSTKHGDETAWGQYFVFTRWILWARHNGRGVYSLHPTPFDQFLGEPYV